MITVCAAVTFAFALMAFVFCVLCIIGLAAGAGADDKPTFVARVSIGLVLSAIALACAIVTALQVLP